MVSNSAHSDEPPLRERIPSAFKDLPGFVSLDIDNDEFFVPVYSSTTKPKKQRGRASKTMQAVSKAVDNLAKVLHVKGDYIPVLLDERNVHSGLCFRGSRWHRNS